MNPDGVTNFEITTGAAGIRTDLCNFMYGQIEAMNKCDLDKGHYGHHHDSRTGGSWNNTLAFHLNTTAAAT